LIGQDVDIGSGEKNEVQMDRKLMKEISRLVLKHEDLKE